jgi:nucleoside-diphosphate-sugar epimerase
MARVLVTGGAGLIGSHVADVLLAAGYEVRLLDNLNTQMHGTSRRPPKGKYRASDIRHCFADVQKSPEHIKFIPAVEFARGLEQLAEYLAGQIANDNVERATTELASRGLVA